MLKIAVVNDSMMAAESLRRVVDSVADYQLAWVAYDGREALQKCRQLCPDIILMDLIMPEMDGVAATRAICAEFQCAILVVTASAHREAALEACHFLIDWLKTKAPFWKLEETVKGEGKWVEARASDDTAADRWTKPGPQKAAE